MEMNSMDRSFLLPGRVQGLHCRIAETILAAGHRLAATARIPVFVEGRAQLHLPGMYVRHALQMRNERRHSNPVDLVRGRDASVPNDLSQLSFFQKLHR